MYCFFAIMILISPVYIYFFFYEREEFNQLLTGEFKTQEKTN